jgi:tight adherence protein C
MIVILLGGLLLAGAAVTLATRALAMPRVRAAETLGQIDAYGFTGRKAEAAKSGGTLQPALDRLAYALGGTIAKRLGGLREEKLRAELMAAGMYGTTPRKFLGYRILSAFGVPAVWLWSASAAGYPGALTGLGLIFALAVGWVAPMTLVRKRAQRRFEKIDYELPELIDLLVVTLEAGLSFLASLHTAAERLEGPLGAELRLMLQEQRMGLAVNEALEGMLRRCETPALRTFVRSVVQGESLGVSTGQIMRNLAVEMRKRRRASAEERAQKAPIKMLFPLIFLIFPSMFIVLLGPAYYTISKVFGGG